MVSTRVTGRLSILSRLKLLVSRWVEKTTFLSQVPIIPTDDPGSQRKSMNIAVFSFEKRTEIIPVYAAAIRGYMDGLGTKLVIDVSARSAVEFTADVTMEGSEGEVSPCRAEEEWSVPTYETKTPFQALELQAV